jgi:hypothetical protein
MAVILRPKHVKGLWAEGTPEVVLPADRTPTTYRRRQVQFLAGNPAAFAPQETSEPNAAYIGMGAWRVTCTCGEAPHADPEWLLSCCFGCGLIWTNVTFPANWATIETLLILRRVAWQRNWRMPETYADLVAEQIAYGDPVP